MGNVENFKVGDRVEILDETKQKLWYKDMEKYINTCGEIVKIGNHLSPIIVRMDLDGDLWYFNEEDLTLEENLDNSHNKTKERTFFLSVSDVGAYLCDGKRKVFIDYKVEDKEDERKAIRSVVDKYYDEIIKLSKTLKIGDTVRVVDNEFTYKTYSNWFIANNIDIRYALKWNKLFMPQNGNEYTVVAIAPYGEQRPKEIVVLIEDEEGCYLINGNGEGLEVIK